MTHLSDGPRFAMPVLGNELVLDLESAFDNHACEVGTGCSLEAFWWHVSPCSCRLMCCHRCKARAALVYLMAARDRVDVHCKPCGVLIDVTAVTFEALA
jgi:hypothetical protein